jgi:hypothetical protein
LVGLRKWADDFGIVLRRRKPTTLNINDRQFLSKDSVANHFVFPSSNHIPTTADAANHEPTADTPEAVESRIVVCLTLAGGGTINTLRYSTETLITHQDYGNCSWNQSA